MCDTIFMQARELWFQLITNEIIRTNQYVTSSKVVWNFILGDETAIYIKRDCCTNSCMPNCFYICSPEQ